MALRFILVIDRETRAILERMAVAQERTATALEAIQDTLEAETVAALNLDYDPPEQQ